MDSMDLTNATSVDELRTKRINANEITVLKKDGAEQHVKTDKVTFGNFIFPIIDENFNQPIDGRKMTRRITKNGEKLDTSVSNCISNIMPVDPDAVDDADTDSRQLFPTKPDKKAPDAKKDPSETDKENTENPIEGGEASDADTEASAEGKYLPDQWLLTRDVLIRVHNKPRSTLFTPSEDKDDPSPLPTKWLDIMRRTQTSCTGAENATIEDFWVHPESASRELGEERIGRTCFHFRRTPAKKGFRWESCRET